MSDWDALELVSDVAGISADPGHPAHVARDVLYRLHESMNFDAAAMCSYDPETGKHDTLFQVGYDTGVLRYLNQGFVTDDPAFVTMRLGRHQPLRWCDVPEYAQTFSARSVFMPHGYQEGISTLLFKADGSYTGTLHLSFLTPKPLRPKAQRSLAALQPRLATVTDPLRSNSSTGWEQHVRTGFASGFLTSRGDLTELPGANQKIDHSDPRLLDVIRRAASSGGTAPHKFWVRTSGKDVLVQMAPVYRGHVVTLSSPPLPFGLTSRELEVLGLLARGLTNPEIGIELSLGSRTVGTHVEHILSKMGCTSRTGAVALAAAQSIVPPSRRLLCRVHD
jgi:DNA-binding NarL/FixJ family response regulator